MEIDSIHFYVTDARITSNWFVNYLGFQLVDSFKDPRTLTIVIKYQSILFVVSSPLNHHSAVAHYLTSHAEGVSDITFRVDRLQSVINNAEDSKIKVLQSVREHSQIRYARVAGWDCLQHSLLEYSSKINCYLLPNGKLRIFGIEKDSSIKLAFSSISDKFAFTKIDHVVLNVVRGELDRAVAYYQSLFELQIQQTFTIKTKHSGLFSQALIDRSNQVQFNINEPTSNNSQIQEFIDLNGGSGIQHLALESHDLIKDVAEMRSNLPKNRASFLNIPDAYYIQLKQRLEDDSIDFSNLELQSIKEQKILVDWHPDKANSLLMQIFTQPILAKPTFFLEFIERRQQAKGFGEGNFKALFAAVEREQFKMNRGIIHH